MQKNFTNLDYLVQHPSNQPFFTSLPDFEADFSKRQKIEESFGRLGPNFIQTLNPDDSDPKHDPDTYRHTGARKSDQSGK